MSCNPTTTPDDVDIGAMREKYRREREKRLRKDGQQQYVRSAAGLSDFFDADPHMPVLPRTPIQDELDVLVVGAGWSGLLASYHLKQRGVTSFRTIDAAGDFGGCWYWNRYPGIQCDNDSYCYIPLLEETGWMPSKKYEDGFAIQGQFKRIANRFGLYEHALFHTLIRSVRWDESIERWRIETNRGDDIRARFVVMAGGPLNRPKLPDIPGMKHFKGKAFHSSRWEYDYTGGSWEQPELDKLGDKRVAIVGTGASSIQITPYLGKYAKQVYVVQRTPSSVDIRENPATDPKWFQSLKPGWQAERQLNFHNGAIQGFAPGTQDMVCDFWTELNRNLQAKMEAMGWPQLPLDKYMEMREAEDHRIMERLRRRVESVVEDKETAEALKPYYNFFCKRPGSSNEYYKTFNLPNVRLIDVSSTRGVARMTEQGFVANGTEYEVDCVIFASGFEVTSPLKERWGIPRFDGRGGLSIYDHWDDGYKTFHGVTTHGFPNFFVIAFTQYGLNASVPVTFGTLGNHIAHIIHHVLERGATTVECSERAQREWVDHVRATAFDVTQIARNCPPSYLNNEGEEKLRWYLGEVYGPGFYAFEALLRDWREKGDLAGLLVK